MKNPENWRKKLKAVLEKEHGRAFSEDELSNVENFMKTMAKMTVSSFLEDQRRQEKLKESPGGFYFDKEGYSCSICGGGASGENSWFDKYGLKCGICQGAIERKEIPPDLGQDNDSWYTDWELERYFNMKAPVLRQWIKKRILNVRTITRSGKGAHRRVFLIRENSPMLPPKELLQSHTVKEIIDGKEWYCSRPWYQFVDPYEHLKGYKILEYLKFVPVEGETNGVE